MKFIYVGAGSSIHNVRWLNSLAADDMEIKFITLHEPNEKLDERISTIKLPNFRPFKYLLLLTFISIYCRIFHFDICHAHYVSGYGGSCIFVPKNKLILSVWGSDVYDFPKRSWLHFHFIKFVLSRSSLICSTSKVMKSFVVNKFNIKVPVRVVPFGVDTNHFKPKPLVKKRKEDVFRIGTVKTLEYKYGIDTLIRAFGEFLKSVETENPSNAIQLDIVGDGSQLDYLEKLTDNLGLSENVKFHGKKDYEEIPNFLNSLNIFSALSRLDSESFGVAVVEASSCGLPVVVSDVGGLPEVVINSKTGFIVDKDDLTEISNYFLKLYRDKNLRTKLGCFGRINVKENYDWKQNVNHMRKIYANF